MEHLLNNLDQLEEGKGNEGSLISSSIPDLVPPPQFNLQNTLQKLRQNLPNPPTVNLNLDEICVEIDKGVTIPLFSAEQEKVLPSLHKELSRKPSTKRETSPKTKRILSLEDRVNSLEKELRHIQTQLTQVIQQISNSIFSTPESQMEKSHFFECIEEEADSNLSESKTKTDSCATYRQRHPKQISLNRQYSLLSPSIHSASLSKQSSGRDSSFMTSLAKIPLPHLKNQLRSQPAPNDHNNDSGSEFSNDESVKQQEIDIAFLYADALVYKNKENILPLSSEHTLSPDKMYDDIVEGLEKTNKQFTILKRPLNRESLLQVLFERPKVLFLNCHGDKKRVEGRLSSHFCFESVEQLALLEEFNEQQLCALLRDTRCHVQLVVISACHSSNLGQQLSDAGIPVVVSINTSVKILEKAAYAFNKIFLDFLIKGYSPQQAFNAGRNNVSSAGEENNKICCCNHDHQDSCLWYKYKEKHGVDKAHKLHTFTCKCFKNKAVKPMEHNYDCLGFLNFYNTLINQGEIGGEAETPEAKKVREKLIEKNKELVVDGKSGDRDFLKSPILPQDKDYKNKLCCCQSTLPHDESQKFILKGREQDLSEGSPLDQPIFQKRASGKVDQNLPIQPEKPLPTWLKNSSLLLDRNTEIHQIISCLDSKQQQIQKRFLQVYGGLYSGRKPVVFRAVRYILERLPLKFSDGVFLVDLEKVDSVQAMVFKFCSDLKLAHPSPSLETLIEDIEKRKMLIIATNCEMIKSKHELHQATCDFFEKMIKKTNYLKIILITEEAALRPFQYEWHCNIEIKPISTEMKIKLFKILMDIENKMGLLKDVNVDDHPLFALADNWFISRIVHQLSPTNSLDDIQADLQEQLLRKQSNESSEKKPESIERSITIRSLYFAEILSTVPSHYELEKNLIFFLAQTPAGVCVTEIQLLCKIYKSWFGTKFDGFLSELPILTEAVQNQRLQSGAQTDLANSGLVIVSKNENIKNEHHYQLDIKYRSAVQLVLESKSQNRKRSITTKTHYDFISNSIEFMGFIARAVLSSIRAKKRGGEVDHRLVTAHLGCGMWWRYTDEEYQLTIDEQAEERFNSYYLTNFKSLLNQEMLESNFKNIWSIDKLSQESEFIFDLCLCVPSILAELNRFQEAIEVIEVCRKFGRNQKLLLHGYLDLMHASIQTYTDKLDKVDRVTQLLQSARTVFRAFDHSEGIAETFYVEALIHINKFNRHMHQPSQYSQLNSATYHSSHQLTTQGIMHQSSMPRPKANDQLSFDLRIYDITPLVTCLTNAQQEFGKMHDGQEIPICNKIFGKAKTLMVHAEFLINNSADLTQDQKEKCEFSRDYCLDQLVVAEELFSRQNHHKYTAYCKCLQAKVLIAIKDEQISQKHDLVNAREIIDQAVKLCELFHDEKIINEIKQVKNKILHYMRAGSTNLFTFAKAWPIVEQNDMGVITSLGEFTRTKFELMPKIERNFGDLNKEIQVKYDLLTEEVLRYVAEFGSRVLHLTSDVIGEGCLCIEGEIGLCKRMGVQELRDFFLKALKIDKNFKKKQQNPLPVDVVVLAIPDSTDLGQVFQEFGVKHVVTFEFIEHFRGKDDEKEAQLMPIRYNYMYTFCVEFYTALVQEQTVNQAFERGLFAVEKNEEMQFELIWQHRDPFGELGIKPVLLNAESQHHNDPLFSSKAVEGDKFYFGPGKVIDTTKARGLLQNIEKSKEAFIGHQNDMFHVLHWLLAPKPNLTHLVHVRGVRSVGKTRFLKEVAYYLYQRHKFESKIQYVDLGKIKTEAELKALLTQMKVFEPSKAKQGQKDDREILLIFDNADFLPQEVFLSFEARLVELMSKNASLRAMVSSKRSLPFKTFLRASEKEQLNQSLSQIGARKRSQVPQRKYWCRELILEPLDDIQAVDLILNTCQKQMTREYLKAEDSQLTIQELLEENVRKCKNLPFYLIEYAHKLSKADSFQDVRVHTVSEDNLKHKSSHFKSKQMTKVTFETVRKSDDETEEQFNKKRVDKRGTALLRARFAALAMGSVQEISESRGSESVHVLRDSESETVEQRSQRAYSNVEQVGNILEEEKEFRDEEWEEESIPLARQQSLVSNPEEYFFGRDRLVSDDRLYVDADNYHQHNQVKRMNTGSSNTNSVKSAGKKRQVTKTKTNPRKIDVFKHKKKSKYELHGSGNKKEILEEINEQEEEQKIPVDSKKTNSAESVKQEKVRKKKQTKQSKLALEELEFHFAKPKHEQ